MRQWTACSSDSAPSSRAQCVIRWRLEPAPQNIVRCAPASVPPISASGLAASCTTWARRSSSVIGTAVLFCLGSGSRCRWRAPSRRARPTGAGRRSAASAASEMPVGPAPFSESARISSSSESRWKAFCSGSGSSHAARAACPPLRVGEGRVLGLGGAVHHVVPRRDRGGGDRRLEAEHGAERLVAAAEVPGGSPSSTLPPPTPSPSDKLRMPAAHDRSSASRRSCCLRRDDLERRAAGGARSRRAARRARRRRRGGSARAARDGRCRTSSTTSRAIPRGARRRAAPPSP